LAASLPALSHLATLHVDLRYNSVVGEGRKDLRRAVDAMPGLASNILLPAMLPAVDISQKQRQQEQEPQQQPSGKWKEDLTHVGSRATGQQAAKQLPGEREESLGSTTLPVRTDSGAKDDRHGDEVPVTTTNDAGVGAKDDGKAKAAAAEDLTEEPSNAGSFLVSLAAVALVGVSLVLGLQARGYDVLTLFNTAHTSARELLNTAHTSARDFAGNFPTAQLDFGTGLVETGEVPIVTQSDFRPQSPAPADTLAMRVDRAASRVSASREQSRDVSIDDIVSQSLDFSDRME